MGAAELSALYPEWDAFVRIRERFDPDGVLMSEHLRDLLGGTT